MIYTKLTILFKSEQKPPYFIGSQLRGAFGYSLKRVICINPSFKCDGCFISSDCLYYKFYEAKNIARKYRFDFKLEQDFYDFNFYLFDDATKELPYVVAAFHMMLTKTGLGKDRTTYQNFDMFINDENILIDGQIKLPQNFIKKFETPNPAKNIKLRFITPLRIKKDNIFIRDERIELSDIVNSIYNRQMQILNRPLKKFPYEIKGKIKDKNIYYKELVRKSNRQKTKMNMGGIMGEMDIEDIDEKSYHILKLGELIGAGKQTVFGLGKIEVENK